MTTLPPVLYSFRRCPYAMRARLALAVSAQRVELREVKLREKPAAMLEASSKATVPVLVLTDGTVIDESLSIMHWALEQGDTQGWWPDGEGLQRQIAALIKTNDGPFKAALDRYKYPNRYASETIDGQAQRANAAEVIWEYEERLAKGGWLVDGRPTLADFAILPFVRQFAHVDRAWFDAQPWPNVAAWLDRFLESERFTAIMDKLAPWQPGDAPVFFPDFAG